MLSLRQIKTVINITVKYSHLHVPDQTAMINKKKIKHFKFLIVKYFFSFKLIVET